jgi:hypothetical protein
MTSKNSDIQKNIDLAWLNLGDISKIKLINPLIHRSEYDIENPGLLEARIMRNPNYLSFAAKTLLGIQLLPMQSVILQELWIRPFPMFIMTRGGGKSWLLAVYILLKCILIPNTKVVVCGAGYRQARIIYDYCLMLWNNASVLRSICSSESGPKYSIDRCTFIINDSVAYYIPMGDGSKIRGLRATTIIADEFASIGIDIYETVVQGFTAVSADPLVNVQITAKRREMSRLGLWTVDDEHRYSGRRMNQAIISGTADYAFKSFAKYFYRYKAIIEAKDDPAKLKDIFPDGDIPANFRSSDYSIIRIPYALMPEGFMDEKQILRAKSTMHSGIFNLEYGCVFQADSEGFFKRSLIESCVGSPSNPIRLPSGDTWFDVSLHGNPAKEYIMGVDPAAERDNFSVVVIEINPDHNRIVYCWSTNRPDFKRRLQAGMAQEHDYYGFCARKLRELMKAFPCKYIAMDSQGGGVAMEEALHDPDKLLPGEIPFWRVIDPDKEQDTDNNPGLHILNMCNFANSEWCSAANNGLKKDMEDKVLLFPRYDPITIGLSIEEDSMREKLFKEAHPNQKYNLFDTLEDCVTEIEELKTELSTIIMSQTSAGVGARDRWDVPEIKLPNGKKGKLRKDRYSALVMCNMVARQYKRAAPPVEYKMMGDFAHNLIHAQANLKNQALYSGPDWFCRGMEGMYGRG